MDKYKIIPLGVLLIGLLMLLKVEVSAESPFLASQLKLSPSLQSQTNTFGASQYTQDLVEPSPKCEPLNTDVLQLCKDIAYNETRYPNVMKQKSQQEAAADTAFYLPLIRINCSPVLKLFLCTLYAPPCVANYTLTLKPCREMCEKAKSGCEDYMKRFQFSWPEYIDCWRFPAFNGPEACVTDDSYSQQQNMMYQAPPNSNANALPVNNLAGSLAGSLNSRIDSNLLSNLNPEQQQLLLNLLTASSNQQQQSGGLG